MSTTAVTEQSSGAMNEAQAAELFESLLSPEKDKAEETGQDEELLEPEAEQEAEEESESDEPEEEDDEAPKATLHTVKVDGKELKVPTEELVAGYQRQADYTRKTQEVAEQRKAAEAEFSAVREERATYAKVLGQLQQQIQQNEPKIDWNRLANENPTEWTRQRILAQDRANALQNIEAERQRVAETEQAENEKALGERIESESAELVKAIPAWKDPAKAKAGKAAMADYLRNSGFKPNEIEQVYDHRPLLLAHKAMLYDALVAKKANLKPTQAAEPVKAAKPGASSAPSKASAMSNASKRLVRTGNVRDAAALFEQML